ncbi:polysaccharide deacetylase family protein [Anaerosporobacter faecicola]|uniref:polysaccharide deacetylase family protein n=1 Tax=Anaerosporobacter faecicola TaxID=2718714 RepID=UPI00143AC117|nr:polysaccharide deacetylase family protein [Anaerosporobacter faecicola]
MEKKVIFVLVIILLIIMGKMCRGELFEPTMQQETTEDTAIERTTEMEESIVTDKEEFAKQEKQTNSGKEETIKEETIKEETKETTKKKTKETTKDASNKIAQSEDYMELYPDMYVKKQAKIPLATVDEDVLGFRKYMMSYPIQNAIQNKKKVAYLTFDDGPSENTIKVLEILRKHNIKATFFMIAETITPDQYELIQEMIKEGHTIGIHTYSHNYRQIYSSVKAYLEDFYLAYKKIYEVTGMQPTIFRFPGGSYNCYMKGMREKVIDEMNRRGFNYYDWQVSAEDSVGNPSRASITRNVLKDFKKYQKPIILMHDSSINALTVQALDIIIQTMKEEGYEFDTVDRR